MKRARYDWQRRRGAITIFVLVCLVIILAICSVLLRIGWSERGVVRAAERRLQAEWLVESGLARGAARLAVASDYDGETWNVSAEELGGPHGARVSISVEKVTENRPHRRLRVRADYPRDTEARTRLTKELTIEIPAKSRGANS